jgi:hypothetical protein
MKMRFSLAFTIGAVIVLASSAGAQTVFSGSGSIIRGKNNTTGVGLVEIYQTQ